MKVSRKRSEGDSWILLALIGAPIAISPWFNMDAINLPKLALVAIIAGAVLVPTINEVFRNLGGKEERLLISLVLLLFVSFLIPLFAAPASFWQQVYGSQGRNTGFIAYTSIFVIFLYVVLKKTVPSMKKLSWFLIGLTIFESSYGFIQYIGLDPFPWRTNYAPVIGTLGNPNFFSSFVAVVSIFSIGMLLETKKIQAKLALFVLWCLSLFVVYKSGSVQGVIVIIASLGLLTFHKIFQQSRFVAYFILVSGMALGSVAFAGFMGIGPLGEMLKRESLQFRFFFWEAGIKMISQHPVVGIGLDRFEDWYRFYRNLDSVKLHGPSVTTDSAHNVFIDLGSGGGLPLLIIFTLLILLVCKQAFQILMAKNEKSNLQVSFAIAWFGFVLQSLISINQLGLATSGWVIGAIVYRINKENQRSGNPPSLAQPSKLLQKEQFNRTVSLMALGASLILVFMPLYKDAIFRSALTSGNGPGIITAARQFPPNPFLLNYAALILVNNSYPQKAKDLYLDALKINPRNYPAYQGLSGLAVKGSQEEKDLLSKMRELDPLNSEILSK